MPLADYDDYILRLQENSTANFQMSAAFGLADRLVFASRVFIPAPATPTTSVALDRTSDHSIGPMPVVASGQLTILGGCLTTIDGGQAVILVDMLNISGGLSGTVTTTQTTNLPTATLTRFTSGEGVMAGLCIWTAIGTTGTTVTVSYTNQAGTSGRVTTANPTIGGVNFREAGRILPIPLLAGDTGVRSVESVTLAGTTATAGNFGVCLFKPLAIMALNDVQGPHLIDAVSTGGFIGALAAVHSDACLSVFGIGSVSQALSGSIILAEV